MSAERLGLDLEIVVRSRCMQKGTAFAIIRSADTTESESRTRFCPLPPAGTRAAPGEKRVPVMFPCSIVVIGSIIHLDRIA